MDEKAIGSAVGVGLEGSNSHVQRDPLRYISFSEIYHDRAWHLHGVGFSQDPSFIPKHIVCDPCHQHKSESPRRTSGIKGADDNEKALRQTRRTHRQTTLSMLHNISGWRGRRHIYFLAAVPSSPSGCLLETASISFSKKNDGVKQWLNRLAATSRSM